MVCGKQESLPGLCGSPIAPQAEFCVPPVVKWLGAGKRGFGAWALGRTSCWL